MVPSPWPNSGPITLANDTSASEGCPATSAHTPANSRCDADSRTPWSLAIDNVRAMLAVFARTRFGRVVRANRSLSTREFDHRAVPPASSRADCWDVLAATLAIVDDVPRSPRRLPQGHRTADPPRYAGPSRSLRRRSLVHQGVWCASPRVLNSRIVPTGRRPAPPG